MLRILRHLALYTAVVCSLTACKGKESFATPPISKADKELSCDEIKLEMNDAEYVKMKARENRGFRAGNIFWPFGYPSTYMSAEEAIDSADERIKYLESIYRIKDCGMALYEKL